MQNILSENMDPFTLDSKLQQALWQRNALGLVATVLLICIALLSIAVLRARERTVLVPAGFQKDIDISSEVSTSYLEEMTTFYATMLLEVTPKTVDYRFSQILKHVTSESYHVIEKYLKEEAQKYKTYNLSTSFVLEEIQISDEPLSVLVTGKLTSKFIEKGVFEKNATYRISYKNERGRLLIKEFNQLDQ